MYPFSTDSIENRVLLCIPTDKFVPISTIFSVFTDYFGNCSFTFKDKLQLLQALVHRNLVIETFEAKTQVARYVYKKQVIVYTERLEKQHSLVKNMLVSGLDKGWQTPEQVFKRAYHLFGAGLRTVLDCTEYFQQIFWLDQLVVDGRATCKGFVHTLEYKLTSRTLTVHSNRSLTVITPTIIVPVCPQARI